MINQTISHYKILEKLGEGGMGVVYKAHDTQLDRDVALKFLPLELTRDPEAEERFVHEAKAASALEHANICSVHEIGEHEGQTFIVMGYYEGATLQKKIESGPLPIDEAIKIIHQVAEGLSKAHEVGIIHRDIKPANIIVTQDGVAKILDFGLAKVTGCTLLTKSGTTLGTAAYMSPEQARGDSVDNRTDLWSLGVTLYEMLAGKRPFQSEYEQALVYSVLNDEPKPLRELRPGVPEPIEKICRRAMAKDVKDRYQAAAELITDLELYKAGSQLSQKTRKALNKKLIFIYAWLVVILVALALIFNPFNLGVHVQQNIAERKPSLAVISFENIPDPADKEYTGESLTNLLITALFQTRDIDVVSRERLYDIQKDIGEGDKKVISATVASQIARRAGVSTMMLASIIQLQPSFIVTYRVIDVETGKIINSQRVSGYPKDNLASLADTLALMVKSDLHVIPTAGATSVAGVTTKSSAAYRAYVEGVDLFWKVRKNEAKTAFEKAVELDSNFAMAHYQLGYGALGGNTDPNEIRKAWELRSKVTEKERLLIEARYASTIEENPARSAEILEQLLLKYPREQTLYIELQTVYWLGLCEYDRALEAGERGLRSDSLDKQILINHCYLLAFYKKRAEALRATEKYLQLAPTEYNPCDTRGDVFLALGEPDSAIQWWQKAIMFRSSYSARKAAYQSLLRRDYKGALDYLRKGADAASDESERASVQRDTVLLSVCRGELTKGNQLLNRHLKLHRGNEALELNLISGTAGAPAGGDLFYLLLFAYEEGNYKEMLRYARERSDEIKAQNFRHAYDLTSPVGGRYEIAWALLKDGNEEISSRLLNDLKKVQRPGLPQRQREYDFFTALCALERGEYDVAVEQFTKSMKTFPPNHPPEYHYAVALLKSGRVADAIAEFQRMTWWPFIDDLGLSSFFSPMYNYWPIASVKAHYWLGVAYEQQGDRDQAIKEYETFLDIWKNVDFKSQEMQEAKVRLTKLKGASTK